MKQNSVIIIVNVHDKGNVTYLTLFFQLFIRLPMQYFTQNEIKPSEKTLNFIRWFAYNYCTIGTESTEKKYCLN